MAGNTNPIFSRVPDTQWAGPIGTTVNTSLTGSGTLGTDIFAVFTADATEGGRVEKLAFKALGTNAAAVARVFLNNGSTNGTAANNVLIAEFALAASTASNTASVSPNLELPLNIAIPAGYRILVCISAASNLASGWEVAAFGSKF